MATLGGSSNPKGLAEAVFGNVQQTIFWPPNETDKTSAVADLRDVFAKYCFRCRLKHHMKKERRKTSFCSPSSGTSSECCWCCSPSVPPLRQLEIHVFGFLVACSYLEWATTGDHQGGVYSFIIHLYYLFIFCQTPCCAELKNAVCVRIKVGLGFRGPPVCSARQRNPKFSQNSLPLPVPGGGVFRQTAWNLLEDSAAAVLCHVQNHSWAAGRHVSFAANLHSSPRSQFTCFPRGGAAGCRANVPTFVSAYMR